MENNRGGFLSHGGTPNGWCRRENPIEKWTMTGGTPISGNLRMYMFNLTDIFGICPVLQKPFLILGPQVCCWPIPIYMEYSPEMGD